MADPITSCPRCGFRRQTSRTGLCQSCRSTMTRAEIAVWTTQTKPPS